MIVPEVVHVEAAAKVRVVLVLWANRRQQRAVSQHDMHLWVVLRHISFHERIISDGEGHPVQALQLQLVEGVRPEHNRVGNFGILLLDRLDVLVEGLLLLSFELFEHFGALAQFDEFASEWCHLAWLAWAEDEMDNTSVHALNQTRLLSASLLGDHGGLDARLFLAKRIQLLSNDAVEERACVAKLLSVHEHGAQQLVLVSDCELVLETIAPV